MNAVERQRRNHGIIAAYAAGEPLRVIGARFGVTPRQVRNISASAGLARPHGRPRALPHASPAIRDDYRRWRRDYGAVMAREMVAVV
jgi:hypothetical protein